jgi:hypothetical protein
MNKWQELGEKLVKTARNAAMRAEGPTLMTVVIALDADGNPQQWLGPHWQRAHDASLEFWTDGGEPVITSTGVLSEPQFLASTEEPACQHDSFSAMIYNEEAARTGGEKNTLALNLKAHEKP